MINAGLNSLLDEISRLKQVCAVRVPATAFTGIGVRVTNARRARASTSRPSDLRHFDVPVRHVVLAALLFQRQREITGTLVELPNSTAHRINARAEKKANSTPPAAGTGRRGVGGVLEEDERGLRHGQCAAGLQPHGGRIGHGPGGPAPAVVPPWPRVHAFFARQRDAEPHDRLRDAVRRAEDRDPEPAAAVVDPQAVKADATCGEGRTAPVQVVLSDR